MLPVIAEMKNKIFYILILIFLGACQTDSKIKEYEKIESTTKVKSEPKKISEVNLTKSDFLNKRKEKMLSKMSARDQAIEKELHQ